MEDIIGNHEIKDCISTLPINLCFRRSTEAEGRYGIWSLREIPKNMTFGPYEGLNVDESECHHTSGFQWKVEGKANDEMILVGREKKGSNWLRYVNYAHSEREQNLIAIQTKSGIYYVTSKIIPINTELLVCYNISSEEVKLSRKKEYNNENLLQVGKCCLIKSQIGNVGSNNELINTKIPLNAEIEKSNRITTQGSSFLYKTYKMTTEKEQTIRNINREITGNHGHCTSNKEKYPKLCKYQKDENKIKGKDAGLRLPDRGSTSHKISERVISEKKLTQKGNLVKYKKIHANDNCYKSNPSTRKYPNVSDLQCHEQILSKKKPHECSECRKQFIYYYQLKLHERIHSDEKPYEHSISGRKFFWKSSKKVDVSSHTGVKQFQCNMGNKKFSGPSSFKVHKRIHAGESPFQCNICKKEFTQLGLLNKHKRIHTGEKLFQCDICNKQLSRTSGLKTHKRIHTGEKPFKCNICNKKFRYSSNLSVHERTHTGEKPFQCNICNKKFRQSQHLSAHKWIHTGEKPFECNICNKKFSRKSRLKAHKRIHTGEKPFQCNICIKKFRHSRNLSAHKKIHTGDMPFECEICKKKFIWSHHLSVHKRVHTGETPVECVVCKVKFKHRSSLKWHTKIHK